MPNPRPGFAALVCAALLLFASTARAWNDAGHTTIDVLVYRNLSAELRDKLDEILRAHPRYEQDLLRGYEGPRDDRAARAEYAFAKAGTWPDMVRDRNNPASAVHHKGNWHYTDVPFFPFGGEDKFKGEPATPAKPGEPYDSISAWEYNLARFHDESLPPPDRAVALCWVLHIGADSHQPCHNTSLYSEAHPTGDKGANEWLLMYRGERRNLHSLWDGWIGNDRSLSFAQTRATEIANLHPRAQFTAQVSTQISAQVSAQVSAGSSDQLAVTNIRDWVREGSRLAIEHVYLQGMITATPKKLADAEPNLPLPQVTDAYAKNATTLSLRQAALAAYRTANALATPPAQ